MSETSDRSDSQILRHDELNLASLNLISAQDDVGDQTRWDEDYALRGRIVRVECRAGDGLVIPHGLDNDINLALLDLYVEQGMPESGVIIIGAGDLLRRAGLARNGQNYTRLDESIDRLYHTNYTIRSGWRDHPHSRWVNADFRLIASRIYTSRAAKGSFDERTLLRIELSSLIVDSMRSQYTKPLDFAFMQSLSRPRTRVVFRTLDALRYDAERPDTVVDSFEVNLMDWARHLRYTTDRPDLIRRALKPVHDELVRRGYLREVTFTGRGARQQLRYVYAPAFVPVSPAALDALRRHGVVDGVARDLIRTYGSGKVLSYVGQFEGLVRSNALSVKKTPAHALVHLIKHNDQYPNPAVGKPPVVGALPPTGRAAPKRAAPLQSDDAPALKDLLVGTPAEHHGDLVAKQLTLLYRKKIPEHVLKSVKRRVDEGRLDAHDMLSDAYSSLASLQGDDFVSRLVTLTSESD